MDKINGLINQYIKNESAKENLNLFIKNYVNVNNQFNNGKWYLLQRLIKKYSNLFNEEFTWNHFCFGITQVEKRECK